MNERDERIDEIIDTLQGTCQSLDSVATEEERSDSVVMERINDAITECNTCGWWVEAGEVDEEGDCDSCHIEPEENEDD